MYANFIRIYTVLKYIVLKHENFRPKHLYIRNIQGAVALNC